MALIIQFKSSDVVFINGSRVEFKSGVKVAFVDPTDILRIEKNGRERHWSKEKPE